MSRLSTTLTEKPWEGVTVKELTVQELDEMLNSEQQQDREMQLAKDNDLPVADTRPTTLDWLLFDDNLSQAMLCTSTGLSADRFSACTPSEINPLVEAVKEVNPAFFQRALADAKRKEQLLQSVGKISGTT